MDIQTKDGILLRNIPDGTPDDAIKKRILRIRSGQDETISKEEVGLKPSGITDL